MTTLEGQDLLRQHSIFAAIDADTLAELDRCAEEQVLPRSWLIARILQDWAGQQIDSRSDTVCVERLSQSQQVVI